MQKVKKRVTVPSGAFVGISLTLLVAISRFVDGYPSESLMEKQDQTLEKDRRTESLKFGDVFNMNDEIDVCRQEALENLQKIFGIRPNKSFRYKTPPQFMMELYNTIADSSGVTRRKNPYNAKIVRSYVERDTRLSHVYLFNISGLEINESVIKAELHLFRKRSDFKVIHPTILRSPYYLIRVYQVLEGQSMDEPDVHRLLNVHYVGAYASGWQVFNVKQAVLAWIAGAPNLGLMVTASTLFGNEASIEFSRRNEHHHSKQPILVLFNDDGRVERVIDEDTSDKIHEVPHYYTYKDNEEDELDENDTNNGRSSIEEEDENVDSEIIDAHHSGSSVDRKKRDESSIEEPENTAAVNENRKLLNKEIDYGTQLGNNLENGQTEFFQRYKRIGDKRSFVNYQDLSRNSFYLKDLVSEARDKKNNGKIINRSGSFFRYTRSANPDYYQLTTNKPDNSVKFVTQKKTRVQQVLSSMDIYERAVLRQQIKKTSNKFVTKNNKKKEEKAKQEFTDNYEGKEKKRFSREAPGKEKETLKCYVDSRVNNNTECTRHELYVDFKDIGLSTLIIAPKGYSAFHCQGRCDKSLTHDKQTTNHATIQGIIHKMGLVRNVNMPCCVPTKLRSISILFFDDSENVVLKMYEDMIADYCGCR